jgi:YhcH/YjgK/YiaL family protein
MKNLTTKYLALAIILMFTTAVSMAQQQTWTTKTAHKWVKEGVWKNGLKLSLHSSTNEVSFAKQYAANKAGWDKAFDFLRERNLELLAPGKYPIDGDNVYASVTEGPSKTLEQAAWESHKNYIDLQYVIRGKEKIGVGVADSSLATKPYDAAKDVANYNIGGEYYTATPSVFFLFFPADAHRPNIKVDGYDVVKKLVIKIKVVK